MAEEKATRHHDPAVRFLEWLKIRQRQVTWAAVGIVGVITAIWFVTTYQRNKEFAAIGALENARTAAISGNLPLAASDLSRVVSTYRGTLAGDEAVILLGQVRLQQGQPDRAAQEVQAAIGRGLASQFRAQAHGLLGTALEELGDHGPAAQAYEKAAAEAWYDFMTAEYLNDAGRAYAASGDTSKAVAMYRRVVSEFEDTRGAAEAAIRVAELEAAAGMS